MISLRWLARRVSAHAVLLLTIALTYFGLLSDGLALPGKPDSEMDFLVVRSNAPGCEPVCPEWIYAEGDITGASPGRFRTVLKAIGNRKLPVIINSAGGDVDAALAIGKAIRKAGLDVAVGRTSFLGCEPYDKACKANDGKASRLLGQVFAHGAFCNSACPLIMAGGTRRVMSRWSSLGVHQITTTWVKSRETYRTEYRIVDGKKKVIGKSMVNRKQVGAYKTYEMGKKVEQKLIAYFKEMGIEPMLVGHMKETSAQSIRNFFPVELLQLKMVTSLDEATLFTDVKICRTVPAANNCRLFTASDLQKS